jgi:hypothetical protein
LLDLADPLDFELTASSFLPEDLLPLVFLDFCDLIDLFDYLDLLLFYDFTSSSFPPSYCISLSVKNYRLVSIFSNEPPSF